MSVERPARRALASPLLQLIAGGALLVGGHAAWSTWRAGEPAQVALREPIVIDAARARALERGFVTRWGRPPVATERAALLGEAAQDEMLYREARVLALGLDDASVRRRLIELMRALGERPNLDQDELVRRAVAMGLDDDVVIRRLLAEKMRLVLRSEPQGIAVDDADLAAALARSGERLRQPESVTVQQVFLSSDRRGDDTARDAQALLAELRAGTLDPGDAAARGDALPFGLDLRAQPRLKLQARFGKEYADAVLALESGVWSEPIASPFGLHLVRVVERRPERLPTVDEVRPLLVEIVRRERAEQNLARGLARLRTLYEVRVADEAAAPADDDRLAAVQP